MTSGRILQKIYDVEISDNRWIKKHQLTCLQLLDQRPFFKNYWDAWQESFAVCNNQTKLVAVNEVWRNQLLRQLNIETLIIADSRLEPLPNDKNLRVLTICKMLNADEYITGPMADQYLDYDLFSSQGIKIKVMDYSRYPEYPQNGKFERHDVSVLDWIASVGVDEQKQLLQIPPLSSHQKIE